MKNHLLISFLSLFLAIQTNAMEDLSDKKSEISLHKSLSLTYNPFYSDNASSDEMTDRCNEESAIYFDKHTIAELSRISPECRMPLIAEILAFPNREEYPNESSVITYLMAPSSLEFQTKTLELAFLLASYQRQNDRAAQLISRAAAINPDMDKIAGKMICDFVREEAMNTDQNLETYFENFEPKINLILMIAKELPTIENQSCKYSNSAGYKGRFPISKFTQIKARIVQNLKNPELEKANQSQKYFEQNIYNQMDNSLQNGSTSLGLKSYLYQCSNANVLLKELESAMRYLKETKSFALLKSVQKSECNLIFSLQFHFPDRYLLRINPNMPGSIPASMPFRDIQGAISQLKIYGFFR